MSAVHQPQRTNILASSLNKNSCAGYKKTFHPDGSISQRDCSAAKLVFHEKMVSQKSTKAEIGTKCVTEHNPFTLSNTSLKVPSTRYAGWSKLIRKTDLTSPGAVPHRLWNGKHFEGIVSDLLPSMKIKGATMSQTHTSFGHTHARPTVLLCHRILEFIDTGAENLFKRTRGIKQFRVLENLSLPTCHRILRTNKLI